MWEGNSGVSRANHHFVYMRPVTIKQMYDNNNDNDDSNNKEMLLNADD